MRITRRRFDGPSGPVNAEHRARLRTYLSDLVRPHGIALHESAVGLSYGDMAESLIRATVPPDEPVDLLILAMALPDARPGRATACYLSHICPGNPVAFAVCDQGPAAAFTALRLAAAHPDARRSLVLVVEQATLFHPVPEPAAVPSRNAGVALLFNSYIPPVRTQPGTPPAAVPARLAAELAGREATLIVGPSLADAAPPGVRVRVAPPGQPMTGVWWELAGTGGPVAVADYDPQLRYLCLANFLVE